MNRKPYLIIVPVLVAIIVAIFIIDAKRARDNEASRSSDSSAGFGNGTYSSGNGDSEARPARRKQRESHRAPQKIRTDSGLVYQVLRKGNGVSPGPTDTVKVIYQGYLPDGQEFDRSPGDRPISFPLNQVIPGWSEGLQLMGEGAIYRFTIPPEQAYGKKGAGTKIGPNQTLIFEVELIAVKQ